MGEEPQPPLFIDAAQPIVVRDVAVVDGREIRDAARPERLGVRQVHLALRREPRVPDPVASPEGAHVERRIQVGGIAYLLRQFDRAAQAQDLEAVVAPLDGRAERPHVRGTIDFEAKHVSDPATAADRRDGRDALGEAEFGGVRILLLGKLHQADLAVRVRRREECRARGVGPALAKRLEHREHRRPDGRIGRPLVHVPGDSAHADGLRSTMSEIGRAGPRRSVRAATSTRRGQDRP